MLCTLECENDEFSAEFTEKFSQLNLDDEYEFEIIGERSPSVVRLYVNGELFSENTTKNGQSDIVNKIVTESLSDQRSVADESFNGTNTTDNSSETIDMATKADQIHQKHFKSIENKGLAVFPAK